MSTKWRSYGIFFQRSRLLVRSFFSQRKFPLLAFNFPYEGFSDCLLVPRNELRPRDCKKRSKTQAGKRFASINIDGKCKSEYNVVFTGFLFELLKTIMFSPKKSCQLTCPLNQQGNVSRHFAVYRDHRPGPLSRLPQTAKARIRELFNFDLPDGWIDGFCSISSFKDNTHLSVCAPKI